MGSPLLSIVIPFYNRPNEVKRLLDLFSNVNESQDWEVIFIDDCSSEFQEVEDFSRHTYPFRSRFYRIDKRTGPGGARNHGIKVSHGELITFLDSDDEFDIDSVCMFLKSCKGESFDYVDFNILDGDIIESRMRDVGGLIHVTEEVRDKLISTPGRHVGKVFKKEFLVKNKIFFPECCFFEDNPFSLNVVLHAKVIILSDIIAYKIIKSPQSITRGTTSIISFLDRLRTTEIGMRYLFKASLHNVTVARSWWMQLIFTNTVGALLDIKKPRLLIVSIIILARYGPLASASEFRGQWKTFSWRGRALVFVLMFAGNIFGLLLRPYSRPLSWCSSLFIKILGPDPRAMSVDPNSIDGDMRDWLRP